MACFRERMKPGHRGARALTSAALAGSGVLAYLAAWQRWSGVCPRGGFDEPACLKRQDHLYDYQLPASPWHPIGDAAELYGLSVLLLAVAAFALPFLLMPAFRRLILWPLAVIPAAVLVGIGVLALLENPEQAALLRDSDDPKFIANAAEELMRYLSIIQNGQRRVAIEDIEIAGETIRAGEGIIIDLAPANWDAKAYPEPDKLDFTRDSGQQLGFGYGRHQCVGQQLARAELQIVFHTLLRRIPTMRLAIPFDEVPFKHDRLAYGVYELPVAW